MNCDLVKTELIAYLKGELEAEKKKRLEEHLAGCPTCRQQLEEAKRVLEWTEAASDEAVTKIVDMMIGQAIRDSASDIHLEPEKDDHLLVRYRVDGVLHEAMRIFPERHRAVVTRLKMMADISVAERRIPQDGRLPFELDGKRYDLRVSSIPFIYGEGMVMRILDQSSVTIGLDKLGLSDHNMELVEKLIHEPNGQIIVTGPTGSGKTTTMYSILHKLTSPAHKIMTVEDPVEYALPGVNQAHVSKKAGFTFSSALRSFLRHDPDIIMIGETRDLETAELAIQAAVTGHLVLSTLHTSDAPSALIRLVDMGIEPFLVQASVKGVISQRLAREVCRNCGTDTQIDPQAPVFKALDITPADLKDHNIKRGVGCDHCRGTGYRGRTGLFEVLVMSHEVGALLVERAPLAEIQQAAINQGFRTLREDAKEKVLSGITTPEEAFRVTAYRW